MKKINCRVELGNALTPEQRKELVARIKEDWKVDTVCIRMSYAKDGTIERIYVHPNGTVSPCFL